VQINWRGGRRVFLLFAAVLPVLLGAAALGAEPASAAPVLTATVEDYNTGGEAGGEVGRVSYTGTWVACGGCVPIPGGGFRYSSAADATATIRFTGTRIDVYGIRERTGGYASISIDGGPPTVVDTYAAASSAALLFRATQLPSSGTHTATLVNLGQRNPASGGYVVGFDRAETFTDSAPSEPAPNPSEPAPNPSEPAANPSGKLWLSGGNGDPTMIPARVHAFCAFRGSPCDIALVYVPRHSWHSVVQPFSLLGSFKNWPGRLAMAVPPFPENVGASLATCASGAYDAHWRTFGETLNAYGRQNSIIRLAWEANGNWFQWSGTDPAQYIGCWRRVADAINSTADPDPILSWEINAHASQNPPSHNPLDLYPGDAWVDNIGIDAYDHYPPSNTRTEFDRQANAMGGITWLYNFARARGKEFGIGEWGVVSGNGVNGGGDNPNYIEWMHEWLTARREYMLYETYFNNCDKGNLGSNLYRPLDGSCIFVNPNSAARYRTLW
jgi:hypothetical protein